MNRSASSATTSRVSAIPSRTSSAARRALAIAAIFCLIHDHPRVPWLIDLPALLDFSGASIRRRFSRARCRRDFTVPTSASTARAISSSDNSSYSARIRTSRCNGGSDATAAPTASAVSRLSRSVSGCRELAIRFIARQQFVPTILIPPPLQGQVPGHRQQKRAQRSARWVKPPGLPQERKKHLLRDIFRHGRRTRHTPGEAIYSILMLLEYGPELGVGHGIQTASIIFT